MTIVGASFGAGLAITLAFAVIAKERHLTVPAWGMLAFGWGVTVLIAPFFERYVWVWPILDVIFGTAAITMAAVSKKYWLAILALLFLGQTVIHVTWNVMQVTGPADPTRIYRYFAGINLLLVAQMITNSWPGGRRVLAVLVDHVGGPSRVGNPRKVARR